MNKVRINQGRVMNSWFRYVGSLIIISMTIVVIVFLNSIYGFLLALVLAFLMILLWTSFHIVEIDLERKMYHDLTVVLGRKTGETKAFDSIEKVFINRVKFQQASNHYSTGARRIHHGFEYKAFVKFAHGETLFLVSDKDEKELIERLQPVLKKLGTEIA